MIRSTMVAFCHLAIALVASVCEADPDPITVPPGLNPGDQYRLVFVSFEERDGTSSNITDYNAFVSAVANSDPDLAALDTSWFAIASTVDVDARDNTGTNPLLDVGVPIFNMDGILVASDNADLWDARLAAPINVTQSGNILVSPFPDQVWTGTHWTGEAAVGGELGTDGPFWGSARISTNDNWVASGVRANWDEFRLYGMSGVLTVIPEPTTVTLMVLGAVGGAMRRQRSAGGELRPRHGCGAVGPCR